MQERGRWLLLRERYQFGSDLIIWVGGCEQIIPLFLGMGGMHGSFAANIAMTSRLHD